MDPITRYQVYETLGLDSVINDINLKRLPVGKHSNLVKVKNKRREEIFRGNSKSSNSKSRQ